MRHRISPWVRTLAGSFILATAVGCQQMPVGRKAEVTGKIVDNFGGPVSGVSISVSGSNYRATSRGDGSYSIQYAPGQFALHFQKSGYVPAYLHLALATEGAFPADTVVIYKLPAQPGIFFVSPNAYLPLATSCGTFSRRMGGRGSPPHNQEPWYAKVVGGQPGAIGLGTNRFAVYRPTSGVQGAEYTNGSITIMRSASPVFEPSPLYFLTEAVPTEVLKLTEDFSIITVTLSPGVYLIPVGPVPVGPDQSYLCFATSDGEVRRWREFEFLNDCYTGVWVEQITGDAFPFRIRSDDLLIIGPAGHETQFSWTGQGWQGSLRGRAGATLRADQSCREIRTNQGLWYKLW